eukprot:Blabericola_migrator_1__9297@NODE_49_length_16431_cov_119_110181_g45_i0_p11_GENE_NODE_49_length_16431_cov_119_110181_g45_i0NODE_49_length_16431_cov_119_110181_g45_i0_p11_ORF_typecomplete_len131_score36_97Ribonuc_LPSP/PF01042_21/1_1e44YjgF_endoribonc/PF14588_6/2_3e05_NODE_49_length_16431_cov_119_110181_g45_i094689860
MSKQVLHTDNAPAAIGPYSQAIAINGLIYTSGQLGLDPHTGDLVEGGIAAQTDQSIKNVAAILEAAGSSLSDVVKATVFTTRLGDFGVINEVYTKHFGESKPARSCIEVSALPKGGLVEIEVVAVKRDFM